MLLSDGRRRMAERDELLVEALTAELEQAHRLLAFYAIADVCRCPAWCPRCETRFLLATC